MNIPHLQGLIAAPFTPFHEDGSLNTALIPAYYALLKANGIKGAFINGSTGEGVLLSSAEKKIVAEAWATATKSDNDFLVITLVGGNSIAECIDLAQHAAETGLYGIAFTSPHYFKPATVELLADSCRAVAASVPHMPFYYYHIPVLNGVYFNMIDLLQELHGTLPNLAGIKYTHEDFMDYLSCIHFANGKYDLLWGRDENMLAALALGAKGSVGSTFNYAAPLYYRLIAAFENGDLEQARDLQQQSIDMIRLLGKYGGIATGKAYMKLLGIDCGAFRLPVRNMSAAQFEKFSEEVEQLDFASFCSKKPGTISA